MLKMEANRTNPNKSVNLSRTSEYAHLCVQSRGRLHRISLFRRHCTDNEGVHQLLTISNRSSEKLSELHFNSAKGFSRCFKMVWETHITERFRGYEKPHFTLPSIPRSVIAAEPAVTTEIWPGQWPKWKPLEDLKDISALLYHPMPPSQHMRWSRSVCTFMAKGLGSRPDWPLEGLSTATSCKSEVWNGSFGAGSRFASSPILNSNPVPSIAAVFFVLFLFLLVFCPLSCALIWCYWSLASWGDPWHQLFRGWKQMGRMILAISSPPLPWWAGSG